MMKRLSALILCIGVCISYQGFAQRRSPNLSTPATQDNTTRGGQYYKKKIPLPADLPQAKLLFVKFSPIKLPTERPKEMPRRLFKMQENHNQVIVESNKQLAKAAVLYPFAYRITTQDSIVYYRDRGYKYRLFHNSFNSIEDGTFRGTSSNGSHSTATYVDLYLHDLISNDKYVIDDFSETFIYYYKGLVGMLTKKVAKQFNSQKS